MSPIPLPLRAMNVSTGTGETIELTHYCYVRDGFTYIPMDFAKTL